MPIVDHVTLGMCDTGHVSRVLPSCVMQISCLRNKCIINTLHFTHGSALGTLVREMGQ